MKIVENILYIGFNEMVKSGISDNTIRNGKQRNVSGWSFIKDPADSRKLLIEFEPLNDRYKEMIIDTFGDPYQQASTEVIKPLLINEPEDVDTIRNYILPTGKYLSDDIQDRYIHACQYLNLLNRMRPKNIKELGFPNTRKWYDSITFMIKSNEIDLPKSYQKLRAKVRDYKEQGASCVISGKFGNQNTRKVKDKQATLIRQLWAKFRFSAPQVAEEYNEIAEDEGWDKICSATVLRYVNASKAQLEPLRKGKKAYQDTVDFVTKRKRPHAPLIRLEGDGTPFELYYQKDGKYWFRKTVYVVIDAFNDTILGYAVGDVENTELQLAAWKHALKNAGMTVPYEIKTDRFSKKALESKLKWVTSNFNPSKAGRSRDRILEGVFGRINKSKIMKKQVNYAGHNITAKDQSVNWEFLKKSKKMFPNEMEVLDQIEAVLQEWNRMNYNGKEIGRYQEWKQNKPYTDKSIDLKSYLKAFGKLHSHTNTLNNEGLTPSILGEERQFMNFDPEFYTENFGKEFNILYDPENLSKVLAYTDEGDEALMENAGDVEMSDIKASEHDRSRLGKHEIFRKNVKELIEEQNQLDEKESEGILKTFFTVSGTNKGYLNAAKQTLKEPSKRQKSSNEGHEYDY